jgi:hypothetical protein
MLHKVSALVNVCVYVCICYIRSMPQSMCVYVCVLYIRSVPQ